MTPASSHAPGLRATHGTDGASGPPSVTATTYAAARWPLWTTTCELVVAGGDDELAGARELADGVLATADRTLSRFRDDSDLARANAAAGRWVAVDPFLTRALAAALRAARITGGLVDPTLGTVLDAWGYADLATAPDTAGVGPGGHATPGGSGPPDHRPPASPQVPVRVVGPAAAPAWHGLGLDEAGSRVRVPPGHALDLGAVGKAFAVDAVAAALATAGVAGIVSIGGDAAAVPGSSGHAWRVDAGERPGGPVAQHLVVHEGAVATSSTLHRRWRHGAATAHHLVDPRTGAPADEYWRTVTTAAATAVDANTASTAAVVLGPDAVAWLHGHGLAARLVGADGRVEVTGGWPAGDAARRHDPADPPAPWNRSRFDT